MSDLNNLYKFLALFGGNSAKQNLNNIDNSAGIGNGDGVLIKAEFDRAVTGNWDIIKGNGWNGEATNKKDLIDKWWASLDVNHSNRKIAGSDMTEVNALSGKELDRIDSLAQDFDWEASRADTNYKVGSVDDTDNNPENNLTKLYDEAVLHYKNIEVLKNLCNEELFEKVMKDVKTLYSVIQVSVSQNLKDCVSNGAIEYDKLDKCVLSAIEEKFSLQNADEIPETVEEQYTLNFQSSYTLTQGGEPVTNEFSITDNEGNAVTYSKLVFSGFEPLSVGQNGSNTFCIGNTPDVEPGTYTGTVTVTIDGKEYTKNITIIVKEQASAKDLTEKNVTIDGDYLDMSNITDTNNIAQIFEDVKAEIIKQLKKQLSAAGIPYSAKINNLIENTFTDIRSMTLLGITIIIAKDYLSSIFGGEVSNIKSKYINIVVEQFNTMIKNAISTMNQSDKDIDTQDIDFSVLKGMKGYETLISGNSITAKDISEPANSSKTSKTQAKENVKKLMEALREQLKAKAKAACKASGVPFDEDTFNICFNNAIDKAISNNEHFEIETIDGEGGSKSYQCTVKVKNCMDQFLNEFKSLYDKWLDKQK